MKKHKRTDKDIGACIPIGETFEIEGLGKFQAFRNTSYGSCDIRCDLAPICGPNNNLPCCIGDEREDETDVIFIQMS